MTEVLFASTFFYRLDSKQWSFRQPYPPLGTLIAASVIRNAKFNVTLFDASLAEGPRQLAAYLHRTKPKYLVIADDGFNYLTKMCLTVMREAVFTMARMARELDCITIVCSSDATDHCEKYFENGVDYVLIGEGEETLRDLLTCLENKTQATAISGIAFSSDGKTVRTKERPVIKELDALPMAAWDLVDIESYRKIWMENHGYFSLNMATTRGCPFKCNWCAKPIYGNRYNSRSPAHVADEIAFLVQTYRPDHFWMCDDIFGLKPNWVRRFREELISRKIKIRYKIQSRVDLLLEEDTIDALADSGAETVWVGAESGSQKILDAMEKGTTIQEIYQATRLLKERGIRVSFFIQFGYPGEDKKDIQATLKMIEDLLPDDIGISVSYPLPGTKFYERVKQELISKQNWRDSQDMALMFQNTYPASYYRRLYRYVHGRYRLNRALHHVQSKIRQHGMGIRDLKKILAIPYYLFSTGFYSLQLRKPL